MQKRANYLKRGKKYQRPLLTLVMFILPLGGLSEETLRVGTFKLRHHKSRY